MRNTCSFITYFQIFRCISSSSTYWNLYRESKFMKKLMHGTHKSRRKWYDPKTDLQSTIDIKQSNQTISAQTMRRMVVRDKLFMKHITDLMSMGEVSDIIKGGIEITCVKITSDFKYVNVFWIHTTDNISSFVSEEALQQCARIIRHELSQLRVIGIVPPIQFVQDKQFSMATEVEKRLAAINLDNETHSEPIQWNDSHTDIIETLHSQPDTNHDSKIDEPYIEFPVMRHDVLGLDHHKIMSQIIASVSKSKEAVQRRTLVDMDFNVDSSSNLVPKENNFLTQKEQKQIFSEFLVAKRKEERRLRRTKQLHQHALLNNFEQEIESIDDPEDESYSDENYSDEFDDSEMR
ncbi:uncharacterized protein LOC114932250 [Nylanderia fulva]|uniref:uncharacterized protein LOC114932250 n=1 Tax=Nylanderia fulva TaxID=613905 RepID=UPI0010FAEED0|nr:uncharacterized protein LOC114932250 [Nylanderia fulva]